METLGFDSDQRALGITREVLRTLGPVADAAGADAVERAIAIARIVAHFDPDPTAVAGTLVQSLCAGHLVATDPLLEHIDAPVVRFAVSLARLGRTDLPLRSQGHRYTAAQAEGLRRMLLAVVSDPRLVLARLAEQLWRLRAVRDGSSEDKAHLGRETQELYAPLANRLGLAALKWELEDFAFRYLNPVEYREIAQALAEKRADRERYIATLVESLSTQLREAGLTAEVYGRPKHLYSIYRKMTRKGLRFEELSDVRAVRVLLASVEECYAALSLVHGRYPYLADEFDDYIATPKANGYRSIHTAVTGPGGRTVEVQIRTYDMHDSAELGIAAHWRYKEGGRRDGALERKVEELRRLLQPSAEDDPLSGVGAELFKEHVYVFSPKGDVVELPSGATPLDFAYHVHTSLGHRCRGARLDGRMVPLDHRLTDGVTVEIITAKDAQPSRDWMVDSLGFLASKSAKGKVRAWFRLHDRDEHLRSGRALAERQLGRRFTLAEVESLAPLLSLEDADELFVALGAGDVSAAQLESAVARRDRALGTERPTAPAPGGTATSEGPATAAGIQVMGVGDLLSHYARCCNPVPPERILGYVTLGRGITIHRSGCGNLARLAKDHPDRQIDVAWGQEREQLYAVEFMVRAFDRRGLVRDVSSALADARLSIQSMNTVTSADGIADMKVATRVHDLEELEQCLARIRGLPDVIRAQRR